jgi:hypothetical protein
MQMEIRFLQFDPIWPLKPYIDKIWLFESSEPMPADDMKMVVPNGHLRLLIPTCNGLLGQKGDKHFSTAQNKMALVGMTDCPSIVDAENYGPVGIIGVEINAIGAYRFFHLRLKEIKNQLYLLSDIVGNIVTVIEQKIKEAPGIDAKVKLLQQFLFSLFAQQKEDALFEYCVRKIQTAKGNNLISGLERETGYSSRWLNLKFEERLGISPKNYSSIVRFQRYYKKMVLDPAEFFKQKSFYDYYYDEAHFIKDFKRFTDMPPAKLMRSKNEFSKTFYKD